MRLLRSGGDWAERPFEPACAHFRSRLIAAMLRLLPPEPLARLLGLLELREGGPAVVAEREVSLRDETDCRQREGQRAGRQRPAVEGAWVCELGLFLVVSDLEDREASMRLSDEVVVRDDQPAAVLPDVLVQELVRVSGRQPLRCDRVDEEAARAGLGLAHSGFPATSAKSHGTRRSRWSPL